ncbi:exosortase/archaeosortase family protein [Phycisphaerales bacterium AB-hyl4]|uniref:Exosortase/archaeosortase family protein n=1 Tax=Natronomicrosphaera hydrolytica TaxID=3242702 RepID=A0ABV4U1P7_9BACT
MSLRETPWGWGRLLGALALAALAVWLTRDAWQAITHYALNDEESSHVLLVAVIAPWLFWVRRHRMAACRRRGFWVGPTIVAVGWACFLIGYDYRFDVLWHAGSVMLVAGAALTFLGRDVLLRFLPAFGALAFLLPVPGRIRTGIGIPLQNVMAQLAESLGQLLGMGISRSGNVLIVNGQWIEVAEACNGMRMFFTFWVVSYTLAFVMPWRLSIRVLLLLATPVLALVTNLARIVPTVWLYGHASEEVASGFHDMAGWLMIVASFLALLGLLRLLEWGGLRVHREAGEGDDAGSGEGAAGSKAVAWRGMRSLRWVTPVVTVLLLSGLAYSQHTRGVPADADWFHQTLREEAREMPYLINDWYGRDAEVPAAAQVILQPNILISRRYENLTTRQSAHFVLVQSRDARHMAHHYPPVCYPSAGWQSMWAEPRDWQLGAGVMPVTEYGFLEETFDRSRRIVVANCMIVPETGWDRDMTPIYAHARDPVRRHYGAAQVQMVFDAEMPEHERQAIFEMFVEENLELLERIAGGVAVAREQ